jgi:hypothetical protein
MEEEIFDMADVLMGRKPPPHVAGTMTLYEIAEAYYGRASEMTMLIQKLEREKRVVKGEPLYLFRTGELRTFRELAKSAADLGSRRLSDAQLEHDRAIYGRDSGGHQRG